MALGQNIRQQRKAKGWTLEELSRQSGVDVGTISALENRDSERSKYAPTIAKALGLSLEELAEGIAHSDASADTTEQEAANLARLFEGRNKAAFAREFAVPGGAAMISQHISGHRPISLEAAAAYARGFGVPLEEISPRLAAQVRQFGGPDSAPAPLVVEDDDAVYASVRTVKLRVSAGIAGFAVDVDEMPGQPIFFRRDWLRLRGFNPAKLHAIKVRGRSMEPTLYAEDMIVFNEADTTPRDGDVFVINFAGEVVVKRLIKEGPVWWMHSDNTDQQRYPRVRCDEHCLLLGRVVHRQSETI